MKKGKEVKRLRRTILKFEGKLELAERMIARQERSLRNAISKLGEIEFYADMQKKEVLEFQDKLDRAKKEDETSMKNYRKDVRFIGEKLLRLDKTIRQAREVCDKLKDDPVKALEAITPIIYDGLGHVSGELRHLLERQEKQADGGELWQTGTREKQKQPTTTAE